MAIQRLFLKDEVHEPQRVGTALSTTYTFKEGILEIYWRGRFVASELASKGDAFAVICAPHCYPKLARLDPPRTNRHLLPWLAGFTKSITVYSRDEYYALLTKRRGQFAWSGYQEHEKYGKGWSFTLCNRPDSESFHRLGCLISHEPDHQMVIGFLKSYGVRNLPFPSSFVRKLLTERFDFDESSINELYSHAHD